MLENAWYSFKDDLQESLINRTMITTETQNLAQRIIFQKYSKKHEYRSMIFSCYRESEKENLEELKTNIAKNPIEKDETFSTEFFSILEPISDIFLETLLKNKISLKEEKNPDVNISESIPKKVEHDNSLWVFIIIMFLTYLGVKILKFYLNKDEHHQ